MTRIGDALLWLPAAAAGLMVGCSAPARSEKPLTPVRVQVVGPATATTDIHYAGGVEPKTRVDLAFKSAGYIQSLAQIDGRDVQDGDRVTRGMVLAHVRTTDYDEKVKEAQSQLAEAEAASVPVKQAFDRATALFKANSITRPEMEQAQGAWDTVQAKLAGARALVQEAQNAQADTALVSPLDGIVLKRLIEVGSLVGPGVGGFVLADTSSVKVVFGAPDTMLRRLHTGMTETVTSEALPGREFRGQITNIAPTADPRSRVFDVQLTIPNADNALRVGMIATIQLDTAGPSATGQPSALLSVPLTAVVRSKNKPDGYAVYVVDDKGSAAVAHLRDVTLGDMVGNSVGVVSGVTAGERVIVSGATIVNDGETVRVIL
jgi:RND family efflux transporter MFP subunit